MPLTTSNAQTQVKAVNAELFSLTPSAFLTMFEIDISTIMDDTLLGLSAADSVFRFHNNIKLINTSIFFNGKEYIALPITAEGFDFNGKGTLPTPKLSLSVQSENSIVLASFKDKLRKYGDCVGSKVTRIRTFAKNIDARNFYNSDPPAGFSPNSYYFSEIYYIDRKSAENKYTIEFELASILDVEGIQLPARLCLANRCVFTYRGEGCLYEFAQRKSPIHGNGTLPDQAPAVATAMDEDISDILGGATVTDKGKFQPNNTYNIGDAVYLTKNNINYYFVCKVNNTTATPPNAAFWINDACSKNTKGCSLRFGINGAIIPGQTSFVRGNLPFGGFAAANKVK